MPLNSKKNLNKPLDSLPSSFNILDNLKCEPKIKNQGQLNSCTAVSQSSILEFHESKYFDKYTEVSPLFIYKISRNLLGLSGDVGSTIRAAMAVDMLFGVPPEDYWPYTDKKGADPDGFDREPSAFCYALAKAHGRLNSIWLRLDLPGISNDLLLERIKNVLDEDLEVYLKFKEYEIPFKAITYDDNIKIKSSKTHLEHSGIILVEFPPEKVCFLFSYNHVLNGLVTDCLVPIKHDLISIDEFTGENDKMENKTNSKPSDNRKMYKLAGPKPVNEDFNLYGFILYDELDVDTADFMSKFGGWISSASGDKCWITILENPELWGSYWKENAKGFYGEEYETIMTKWKERDPSYRNMTHKIADEFNISIDIFPCIIFLKSLKSKTCSRPYPLINDNKFYRKLFSTVHDSSKNSSITLQKLDENIMDALNTSWFIPQKIDERAKLFNKYADPILNAAEPIINILSKFFK